MPTEGSEAKATLPCQRSSSNQDQPFRFLTNDTVANATNEARCIHPMEGRYHACSIGRIGNAVYRLFCKNSFPRGPGPAASCHPISAPCLASKAISLQPTIRAEVNRLDRSRTPDQIHRVPLMIDIECGRHRNGPGETASILSATWSSTMIPKSLSACRRIGSIRIS